MSPMKRIFIIAALSLNHCTTVHIMRIVPFLPDVRVGLDGISYEGHDFTAGQNKRQGEVQPWSSSCGRKGPRG